MARLMERNQSCDAHLNALLQSIYHCLVMHYYDPVATRLSLCESQSIYCHCIALLQAA